MDALIAPTPYRLAKHHGEIDAKEVSQTTKRYACRLVGVVEGMFRRGDLTREQWHAYQRLERYIERANSLPACTRDYIGDRGGTEDPDNPWGPMDARISASEQVAQAKFAIGHPRIAEALVYCAGNPASLEDVGRLFSNETSKPMAIAAARQIIQVGTYRLDLHYSSGHSARGSPKAA